jgi:predicted Zn-dependent protease
MWKAIAGVVLGGAVGYVPDGMSNFFERLQTRAWFAVGRSGEWR